MKQKLEQYVIVLTGATNDIGRPLAEALSLQGTKLVLASRESSLDALAQTCAQYGGDVLPLALERTDFDGMERLAQRILDSFGRIDVWINNDTISLPGRFEELPMEDHRRVLETGLFGTLHGARAALPVFYRQGYGSLINNAALPMSTVGTTAGAYFISRHGIRGLGAVLRQEADLAGQKHIHISSVLPATMDDDGGRKKEIPSAQAQALQIADTILACVLHPRREVFVGAAARTLRV